MQCLLALSAASLLQPMGFGAEPAPPSDSSPGLEYRAVHDVDVSGFGPNAGEWEVTLGGGGSNDKNFNGGGFNVTGSLGYFLTENWEVVFRQGFAWSDFGHSTWNGYTRGAVDYHFNLDRFRPFIGVNFGGIYGRGFDDTWAAGVEAGAKFYVQPHTFIFVMAEYDWTFSRLRRADNEFDSGQFIYHWHPTENGNILVELT